MALRDRPAHEAVPRPQVEDVELVDPRRPDQQRPLQHLLCYRVILDQLHQIVLIDHLSGGDADILADLEGVHVGHLDVQLALAALEIAQQVAEALKQVLAAGLRRLAQHFGVGHQEVRRAHGVDELARIEVHLLRRLRFEPIDMADHVVDVACRQQVRLANEIEDLVLLPRVVLEAAVGRGRADHLRVSIPIIRLAVFCHSVM